MIVGKKTVQLGVRDRGVAEGGPVFGQWVGPMGDRDRGKKIPPSRKIPRDWGTRPAHFFKLGRPSPVLVKESNLRRRSTRRGGRRGPLGHFGPANRA